MKNILCVTDNHQLKKDLRKFFSKKGLFVSFKKKDVELKSLLDADIIILSDTKAVLVDQITSINLIKKPWLIFISENSNISESFVLNTGFDDFYFISDDFFEIMYSKINKIIEGKTLTYDYILNKINEKNDSKIKIRLEQRLLKINNDSFKLTKLELRLVTLLLSNDKPLNRDFLEKQIYFNKKNNGSRNIDSLIFELRSKLGIYKNCIESVRSLGYYFNIKNIKL